MSALDEWTPCPGVPEPQTLRSLYSHATGLGIAAYAAATRGDYEEAFACSRAEEVADHYVLESARRNRIYEWLDPRLAE